MDEEVEFCPSQSDNKEEETGSAATSTQESSKLSQDACWSEIFKSPVDLPAFSPSGEIGGANLHGLGTY